ATVIFAGQRGLTAEQVVAVSESGVAARGRAQPGVGIATRRAVGGVAANAHTTIDGNIAGVARRRRVGRGGAAAASGGRNDFGPAAARGTPTGSSACSIATARRGGAAGAGTHRRRIVPRR